MTLSALTGIVRDHPGLRGKRELTAVAAVLGGDGDDAAVLPGGPDGELVLAAEAIRPGLVAARPRVAGVAGVVSVVNDLAATGARPLALLDCLVAGSGALAREVLEGIRAGAALYRVPVVGGHATVEGGLPEGLSTFALGRARRPLRAAAARAGDAVCLATCLQGEATDVGGEVLFSHLRGPRRERARADLDLVAAAADAGETWAARDVSMPGVAGSLLQLCESAGGLGAVLDLDVLPVPPGMALDRWMVCFPSYGFLLVGDPAALVARFGSAGLACARVATLDGTGALRLRAGGREEPVWDLADEPLTGLRPGG